MFCSHDFEMVVVPSVDFAVGEAEAHGDLQHPTFAPVRVLVELGPQLHLLLIIEYLSLLLV